MARDWGRSSVEWEASRKAGGFVMPGARTWRAMFYGRRVGSIGVSVWSTTEVQAEDEDAARLKLYDEFEHIERLRLVEVRSVRPE